MKYLRRAWMALWVLPGYVWGFLVRCYRLAKAAAIEGYNKGVGQ